MSPEDLNKIYRTSPSKNLKTGSLSMTHSWCETQQIACITNNLSLNTWMRLNLVSCRNCSPLNEHTRMSLQNHMLLFYCGVIQMLFYDSFFLTFWKSPRHSSKMCFGFWVYHKFNFAIKQTSCYTLSMSSGFTTLDIHVHIELSTVCDCSNFM